MTPTPFPFLPRSPLVLTLPVILSVLINTQFPFFSNKTFWDLKTTSVTISLNRDCISVRKRSLVHQLQLGGQLFPRLWPVFTLLQINKLFQIWRRHLSLHQPGLYYDCVEEVRQFLNSPVMSLLRSRMCRTCTYVGSRMRTHSMYNTHVTRSRTHTDRHGSVKFRVSPKKK